MRAVYVRACAPVDEIGVEDIAAPQPGPGEVVVDVVAAEVNFPDILVIEGNYQIKPPLPFSPGKGAAGRVSAVGAGVQAFALGDAVAVQVEYGAYAEKLKAPAAQCTKIPPGVPFDIAAALGLGGLWLLLFTRALGGAPLLPVGEPEVRELIAGRAEAR